MTTSDAHHDDRPGRRTRGLSQRAARESDRVEAGLTVELLDDTGKVIASNPVTFVAPRADDATQSVLVKATLRQRPLGLRVMQYVRARLIWSNDPALVVPIVAVNRIAGQHFVFVAEGAGEKVRGASEADHVGPVIVDDYVVLRGLMAGDRVIVSNVQKIGEGAPITPLPQSGSGAASAGTP